VGKPAESMRADGFAAPSSSRIFERVMCGIDGSGESFEGVRQAHGLAPPEARFVLFGVADILAIPAGWQEPYGSALDAIEDGVRAAVHTAAQYAPGREPREIVVDGSPLEVTRELFASENPSLVVVGAKRGSRALGIMLSSLATELVHVPTRPALLARFRATDQVGAFPQSISVGVDGSPPSLRALESAHEIAARLGCSVTAITVGDTGDLNGAPDRLGVPVARYEGDPGDLLAHCTADLVVVGSAGKSGVHALGSVSERVAHHARSSVLVIP
jgi:nucleotide-binding universal stress UspA family protein